MIATRLLTTALILALSTSVFAEPTASPDPTGVQLSFHCGLTQPLLLRGFNAAVDVRRGRWIASYSHGQGLVFSKAPGTLTDAEDTAGMRIVAPISTGGGIGYRIWKELYLMADVKLHRFEVDAGREVARYSTVTIGAEVGYRFFIWRGFHITPVVRFWPNVWDDAPAGGVMVQTAGAPIQHEPIAQGVGGLFVNVLLGWAFDL